MKKFFIFLSICLCILTVCDLNFAAADFSAKYFVTANSATIFEAPNISSQKLKTLSHKDEIWVETSDNQAVEYTYEYAFFKVTHQNIEGYVLADLIVPKSKTISSIPNFNAKTNERCTVYLKADNEFVESNIALEKHEKIFLYEGFDKKKDYTAISYLKDNEIFYGYLKTENIAPNGINPIVITCISLIVAVVGIVFAWVFMKKKKVKIKK